MWHTLIWIHLGKYVWFFTKNYSTYVYFIWKKDYMDVSDPWLLKKNHSVHITAKIHLPVLEPHYQQQLTRADMAHLLLEHMVDV